jgi:hypothetical protein
LNVSNASPGLQTQAFTAFSAACGNHCTATFGFHAYQKAMGTCTTGFGWLIGTFHYLLLPKVAIKLNPATLFSQLKFADFKNPQLNINFQHYVNDFFYIFIGTGCG